VFRHHHHPDTIAGRVDELMVAVFIADDQERVARLRVHLAPDFVYISPGAVVDGPEGLSDAFSHYRHDAWLNASLHRTSVVDTHHANFRYTWQRQEGGRTTMEGCSFGWLSAEGLISHIVSFDGLAPGQRQEEQE
jgi:hypothetical protein